MEFKDDLESGGPGPVMIVIPGGRFLMGSPKEELERPINFLGPEDLEPLHEVEITPFAMGKFAVTFEEYDHFAAATGRKKPDDRGWGRGRRPVIEVTWFDAIAYTKWLSWQTGQHYRLPTEEEWEYACRAGTTTPFHFGETISTNQANYNGYSVYGNGYKGVRRNKTVEVGQFPANAWGLHEMHGNVDEWMASEYSEDDSGPADLKLPEGVHSLPNNYQCALRGGSWTAPPEDLRAAVNGYSHLKAYGRYNIGFRLARTSP